MKIGIFYLLIYINLRNASIKTYKNCQRYKFYYIRLRVNVILTENMPKILYHQILLYLRFINIYHKNTFCYMESKFFISY